MALSPGTLIGSYRIVGPLGAGGMGEVYRAADTRLGREVALKVLPEHLSNLAEARERFDREARVISSLSHPNICTLFDIGEQAGVSYLVMELLEGETLASRLTRGPMKLDEALRCGAQVADALDKAHRRGIVHRDLKPANLMLTRSGVKVLDFGVAKLRDERGAAMGPGVLPTMAPTRTTPLTTQGAIVGTMQYMAPEQLEGKPVDHRADIFSLGAVLYEMLTGRRAFDGASQASVIAAILEREPRAVSDMVPASPASLDHVIKRCLAKDPDERWQSALDIRSELEWIGQQSGARAASAGAGPAAGGSAASGVGSATAGPAAAPGQSAAPRARLPLAATLLALAVVGAIAFAAGWMMNRPAATPARLMRASLVLPSGTVLDTDNASIALSPDGTMLVYAGREQGGASRLFVRSLDSLTSQPMAGTEGASYPFWSPDGRQIGFFADRKLKKVPASGGAVQSICDAEDGRGASWGSEGTIVFAPLPKGGLSMVPSSGGAPVALTTPADGVFTHRNPHFLPDGKRVLYFSGHASRNPANGIHVLDIDTRKSDLVLQGESEGIYVEPGYLAFVREGNLMAQRFDPGGLQLAAAAVPIAENVQFNTFRYTGTYTFSSTGLMLFQSGAIQAETRLTWYGLDGKALGTVGEPAIFWLSLQISPEGRRAAGTVRHPDGGSDVWLYDLTRGVGTRFTFGETSALLPIWSPDGRQVAYADGAGSLYLKAADGSTPARKIFTSPDGSLLPFSWSPDGTKILFAGQSPTTGGDLWVLTVTDDPKPVSFLASEANEFSGVFSPDGRWVAYTSDESGRNEVYVRSYPGPGGRWQVSAQGAASCAWRADGQEIFFQDLEGRLYAVTVTAIGAALEVGPPRSLFGGQDLGITVGAFAADGKRFLGAARASGAAGPVLTLVTDWASALGRN